jgi:rhamnogalacturonyl hydrolase YesR
MFSSAKESLDKLKAYCEAEDFKGWDPFDGLNSEVFKNIPIVRKNALCRLIWIQTFKKNPINLRKLLFIKKDFNPKGLGLFLNGYCNLYQTDPKEEYLDTIRLLADRIIALQTPGYSGTCWGYNFDWQSRAFFQPRYTPTIVASAFIGYALLDAFDLTANEDYRKHALSVCDFILKDLNRTTDEDGDFAFSYSPLDNTQVFNASLLGSRMLARAFSYTQNEKLLEPAKKSVAFCVKNQRSDGSWTYSKLPFHQWIDNFHTGYNLECISEYQKFSGDRSYNESIVSGLDYYLKTFFTSEGIPKYYNNAVYPIDIHAPAQLIITLFRLGKGVEQADLIKRVLTWTIENMQSRQGYFYFQKNKFYTTKIPYMRWSQAWMFYALCTSLLLFTKDSRY